MTVKVCDALCGSGKTSACIRMMNENVDRKFIFVTQFLSEVSRIMNKCKSRDFVTPDGGLDSGKTKMTDLRDLLAAGRNIATTHALFVCCPEEVKTLIKNGHYVLVLDETVDIMRVSEFKPCDVNMLARANIVEDDDGVIRWIDEEYEQQDKNGDGIFSEAVKLSKSKNLLSHNDQFYYWSLPPELFGCFDDVYVLTYLFHAQLLRCFFDMYKVPYEYIGVKKDGSDYTFCPPEEMDRTRELRDKIHILEHKKLNYIGAKRTDLSFSSYSHHIRDVDSEFLEKLRKNLINLFRNVFHAPSKEIMWTTFKEFRSVLSSKGYAGGFVSYNKRASNEYADRRYLAYCVNNFLRPWEARYYSERGAEIDNDTYGLSFLVQWIFRSAIRNGEEVWIYIPSARMRSLLKQWLDNLADGRDLEPVVYKPTRGGNHSKKGARR
ncbi:MAG: hypothetical protein IKP68_07860 [Clostridia bacterium]|nr:hypothetical protein [Clostridia bacterium]